MRRVDDATYEAFMQHLALTDRTEIHLDEVTARLQRFLLLKLGIVCASARDRRELASLANQMHTEFNLPE